MTTKYNNSIFLFTRDLRLKDNTTLNDILENSENVLPIFILDKRQITEKNSFRSINCIQFMFESLQDLNSQLIEKNSKLYIFYGITEKIIEKLLKNNDFIDKITKKKITHILELIFEKVGRLNIGILKFFIFFNIFNIHKIQKNYSTCV